MTGAMSGQFAGIPLTWLEYELQGGFGTVLSRTRDGDRFSTAMGDAFDVQLVAVSCPAPGEAACQVIFRWAEEPQVLFLLSHPLSAEMAAGLTREGFAAATVMNIQENLLSGSYGMRNAVRRQVAGLTLLSWDRPLRRWDAAPGSVALGGEGSDPKA